MRLDYLSFGRHQVPCVLLDAEHRLSIEVRGFIGNSVTTSDTGRARTMEWKRLVARAAKEARGEEAWDPRWKYAVTIGMSFHLRAHGGRDLDVENFLKPAIDALAAGLFCSRDQDVDRIARYGYDDSNFRTLLVHRLPDAESIQDEGAVFCISAELSEQMSLHRKCWEFKRE